VSGGVLAPLGLPGLPELGLFMLAVLVLNATPGVDLLLTVSRTLAGGGRAGAAAALGITAGCAVHVLAAAFGLAALLATAPHTFVVLKWTGAAYLLWLAADLARRALRPSVPAIADANLKPGPHSAAADFRVGLLTNLLNPKVALFFLAFVPQFITPATPHKTLAFLALGAVALAQGLVFLLGVVALATQLRSLMPGRRTTQLLHAAGAALFAGLALRLAALRL
jgi:threonine/homoserine/homoserine lactone efflux protein